MLYVGYVKIPGVPGLSNERSALIDVDEKDDETAKRAVLAHFTRTSGARLVRLFKEPKEVSVE